MFEQCINWMNCPRIFQIFTVNKIDGRELSFLRLLNSASNNVDTHRYDPSKVCCNAIGSRQIQRCNAIEEVSDISPQESRDRIKSSIQKYYTLAT